MANINFYVPDKDETKIRQMAMAEGVSISELCRRRVLAPKPEHKTSEDNVLLESAIHNMHGDMQDMLKKLIELNRNLLRENRYYGELLGNYFTALFTSEETNLQESFNLAKEAAEEAVKDL